jgi:hypothetical protein
VIHGDVREEGFSRRFDGIVTSPPYPGLIDRPPEHHEQR